MSAINLVMTGTRTTLAWPVSVVSCQRMVPDYHRGSQQATHSAAAGHLSSELISRAEFLSVQSWADQIYRDHANFSHTTTPTPACSVICDVG